MSQSGAMKTLVPRVFPFLSHSSIHVRKAGLETLLVLSSGKTANLWLPDCILDALRHVYQRALLEHNSSCVALIPKLWNSLCDNTPLDPLLLAGCPWFGPWIHLISGWLFFQYFKYFLKLFNRNLSLKYILWMRRFFFYLFKLY